MVTLIDARVRRLVKFAIRHRLDADSHPHGLSYTKSTATRFARSVPLLRFEPAIRVLPFEKQPFARNILSIPEWPRGPGGALIMRDAPE
jgi:hypothetical protein